MRRIASLTWVVLLACSPVGPPDLGSSTETSTSTSTSETGGDGDPGVYGWCCDCDLVPRGGPTICQPSYIGTCGDALVWCETEPDCYALCSPPGDGDSGDGDGDGWCEEPIEMLDVCPTLDKLPVLTDPPCCDLIPEEIPCAGENTGETCFDSRRYVDGLGAEHWVCCPVGA
jgi:hypothetical protein